MRGKLNSGGTFMFYKRLYLFGLLALLCGSAFADIFDAAAFQARYITVMEGSKQDMLSAVDYLNDILREDPQNPEALVYKGSILAKVASVDILFWNKLARVNEGIDLMARGMELLDGGQGNSVADNQKLIMYINRGITCASIPGSFRQRDIAIRELERAKGHPHFLFVDAKTQAKVLASLSKAYRGKGNKETAARLLQEATELDAVTAEKYAE
jgi:tetratricopeptide (TPR) repeat protein